MAERKVVYDWNVISQIPQIFQYNFLVQNEPREIDHIRCKLFAQLKPLEESQTISDGLIRGSGGIHYAFFSVLSSLPNEILDFRKIYDGKVKIDRRLHSRVSEQNWNDLIRKVEDGIF